MCLLSLFFCVFVIATGCNNREDPPYGEGHDFGQNNPDLYLCFGDSMTQGVGGVTPYPRYLSDFLGKPVINQGRAGESVEEGLARLGSVLDRHKPGFCLIMHGVNDIIHSGSPARIAETIRSMIQVAKARNVLPAVSTITPFVGKREVFNGSVEAANELIRAVAKEEDVRLVDCARVIRGRQDYVLDDGLHYSEAGSMAVAAAWSDRL
ncbi:MAG: SGNH/GDSL hydrolase family protein [Kiritimatiellia bacterium]